MHVPNSSRLTFSVLPLLLAGCASVPQLGQAPQIIQPQAIAASNALGGTETRTDWPAADWWTGYGDPQLSALIAEGLAGSPDLAAAAARLRAAQGYAQQAGAARLPSIGVEANASANKQSYNNGVPAAFVPQGWNDTGRFAATLNFDLDLWGKNRAALAAATSESEAARLDREQVRIALTTNIASAYADLARLAATREVQARALELRQQTRALVADRVAAGLDNRAELKQADAAVPLARADLAATDEAIGLTRNRLAALVGQGPDRGLTIALPARAITVTALPAGVTTDLIGRRPDIASARARVEAAASRIKVARAAFYPAVNLSALVGLQSLGLANLFDSGSTFGQAGPAISLPIFHGGQLAGQYKGARAQYDEAVANYDSAVLSAYREVADAVTSRRALADRLAQAHQALTDTEEAYALAQARYRGGLSRYLDVLTAEDRVLQARLLAADLEARAFTLDVALIRALGGGFSLSSQSAALPVTGAAQKDTNHG